MLWGPRQLPPRHLRAPETHRMSKRECELSRVCSAEGRALCGIWIKTNEGSISGTTFFSLIPVEVREKRKST